MHVQLLEPPLPSPLQIIIMKMQEEKEEKQEEEVEERRRIQSADKGLL